MENENQETEDQEITEGQGASEDEKTETPDVVTISKEELEKLQKTKAQYTSMEAQRNAIEAQLKNVGRKFAESGIGHLDQDFNFIINQPKPKEPEPPKSNPIQELENSLSQLQKQWKNGDIEDDDYYDKKVDIRTKIGQLEFQQQLEQKEQDRIRREKEQQEIATTSQINDKYKNLLDKEFPGHNNVNDPLFLEMSSVWKNNLDLYGDANTDYRERYKLAEKAAIRLKEKQQSTGDQQQRRDAEFGTTSTRTTGEATKPPVEAKLDKDAEDILYRGGYDQETINRLRKDKGFTEVVTKVRPGMAVEFGE